MIRVVLDTNLIVSGALWLGLPGQILDAALDGHIHSVSSEPILAELTWVLDRDKFAPKFKERGITAKEIIKRFRLICEITDPPRLSDVPVRDPKDVMLLECAVAGKVDYLVSGDKDLTDLGDSYRDVKIVTPAQFLAILAKEDIDSGG